jgi:non-ribosomal peptide synthetase component F
VDDAVNIMENGLRYTQLTWDVRLHVVYQIIYENSNLRQEHIAVDAWDCFLTYHQLIVYTSVLCLRLQALGVKPGTMVAACFRKLAWAVVAMSAINKAGACFVP